MENANTPNQKISAAIRDCLVAGSTLEEAWNAVLGATISYDDFVTRLYEELRCNELHLDTNE